MMRTDPRLGRRIQLRQGLAWLAAAQGDPYGALLRGLDEDPRPYWNAIAQRPLSRSLTGDWVTARHHVAEAVRSQSALRTQPPLEGIGGSTLSQTEDTQVAWPVRQGWEHALASRAPGVLEIAALTRTAAVGALARHWGADPALENVLATASALADGALDSPFYPPGIADSHRIAEGLDTLRRLPLVGASQERMLLATAGVTMATGLVIEALEQCRAATGEPDLRGLWSTVRAQPHHAARVVAETLRLAPPAQLHATLAEAPCEIAGHRIEEGERVIVVVGAANRDPQVFTEPNRFDPGRPQTQTAAVLPPGLIWSPVASFAAATARQGLLQLAPLRPGPALQGAAVRRPGTPVSRSVVAYPAATS